MLAQPGLHEQNMPVFVTTLFSRLFTVVRGLSSAGVEARPFFIGLGILPLGVTTCQGERHGRFKNRSSRREEALISRFR